MGKNYRQLDRPQSCKIALHYGWCTDSNVTRRKMNRTRYQVQAELKWRVKHWPEGVDDAADFIKMSYARWAGRKGKKLKLVSTRRFVNYHQAIPDFY